MTALNSSNPLGYVGINPKSNPGVIIADRAPTANDIQDAGKTWINKTTNIVYITLGGGTWQTGGNNPATTTEYGTVLLNESTTMAGASNDNVPTSLAIKTYADNLAIAGAPDASESVKGIAELATQTETDTGTDDLRIVTPLKLTTLMTSNPPAIGTSNPAAGSFTTLAASGLASLSGSATITTGATALNLASDASTGAVNIGTGAAARTITIGNTSGASSVVVDCGTGAASFGASATAHTTTIGSTTGASALVLQAGTGDITFTGTVKEINAEFLYSSGTDLVVSQSPIMQSNANTGVAPTGTGGDVNLMYMQDGCLMEQFIIGTQTIIAPRMTANGLNLALDNTASDGSEYNFGARNNAKHAYTIGTSPAFFITARIYVEDLSGCAPLMIGFRKVEANNATFSSYSDYAGIGLNSVTSATNVVMLTQLNGGGQTATDSTDAWGGDGSAQTITVLVSAAGVVTFEINGVAASAAPSFTFDSTDVVMPFIHFVQGADVSANIDLQELKIGFQA